MPSVFRSYRQAFVVTESKGVWVLGRVAPPPSSVTEELTSLASVPPAIK